MLLAQEQRSCVGFLVEYTVYQSDFHAAVCRKTVQYTPPAVQNGALIVQTGYGIVNIGKRPCLAEFVVSDLPDRIRKYALNRDKLLHTARQAYRLCGFLLLFFFLFNRFGFAHSVLPRYCVH